MVEANNRIRELEGDERREIIRILTEFTNLVEPMVPDILYSYEFMAEMDYTTKIIFADQIKGIRPIVEDKQQVDWARAIHPLLYLSLQKQHKEEVIPLDIELNPDKRILVDCIRTQCRREISAVV